MHFQDVHSLESRINESSRIKLKYPNRTPVITHRALNEKSLPDIDKKKYLVPRDLTLGQFAYVVRKRMDLTPEKALFIFVNNKLPPTCATMAKLYDEHADEDGFLYVTYAAENTFGGGSS